jgi:type V secretory pathway adhesin AidA
MNTVLNDANPSTSDVLSLGGTTPTGTTTLKVTHAGGPGAQTIGNGILLVSYTGSAVAAGMFTLDGSSISAGGYVYTLAYVVGQGWFLQSTLAQTLLPTGTAAPVPDLGRTALMLLALLLSLGAMRRLRRQAD